MWELVCCLKYPAIGCSLLFGLHFHSRPLVVNLLSDHTSACSYLFLAETCCHAAVCPVVCFAVPHVSTCYVSMLFPPCHHSPDSAVRVLSPTGKTPESRSAVQNWRILGITHVWWRIHWERTTPLALLTSKAVSTLTPKQRVKQHRCTLLLL